jgi:pimeloyl-ACP methyl ester carboxylesterase
LSLNADPEKVDTTADLATRCTEEFLARALTQRRGGWTQGRTVVGGVELEVEYRHISPYLQPPLQMELARDVSMAAYHGERYAKPGFGVPMAILTPRCKDAPLCGLVPPEGVFRGATAWIEVAPNPGGVPKLVLADPLAIDAILVGGRRLPLAIDTSAAWARGAKTSKLHRLAIWGLLGGHEVGRRSGVYLLEDYDPNKRPVIMIHGLGSSPLMWARLSNALWGDPYLRSRFQVWHVVYQTNAPLLVTRRRVQGYLDDAWRVLDPDGDDPAHSGMVLVGHSLGGVVSRMLCVDSGDTLLNAAFVKPPEAWQADASDRAAVEEIFRFSHYPGVTRAIFIAAPHRGSPRATNWFGRLVRVVVGRRAPEIRSLRRLARSDPEAIQPSLRRLYQRGAVNSISTLQSAQPVRAAGEALMPVVGVPYHTIAGSLPHHHPETDGVVPLSSAALEGAASTLVLPYGHDVYDSPEAVAEVLRILRLEK